MSDLRGGSTLAAAKERIEALIAASVGRDRRDGTLVGTISPVDLAELLSYVEALEREQDAIDRAVIAYVSARAATDALRSKADSQ